MFFSPGTLPATTSTVTAWPVGGVCPSGMSTVAFCFEVVAAALRRTVIGLGPPRTVTVMGTLRSLLSPWLANVTRNVGVAAGTRLTTCPGWSVTPPTETLTIPWPCRPGATPPVPALPVPPHPWPPIRSQTTAGESHSSEGSDFVVATVCPETPFSSSASLIRGATRWL